MAVPTKIILKSTTALSLNDRFSTIKAAPVTAQTVRQQQQTVVTQASQKNRRLALQMANRPSVQAALKQRLGVQGRLGRGAPAAVRMFRGRGMNRGQGMMRGQVMQGQGMRGQGMRGQGRPFRVLMYRGRGQGLRGQNNVNNRFRGGGRFLRGGGMQRVIRGGGQQFVRGGNRGRAVRGQMRGRGGGSARGMGRGRGGRGGARRGGVNSAPSVSRESLDAQLDQYMSLTD